jgi:hypothetical protein
MKPFGGLESMLPYSSKGPKLQPTLKSKMLSRDQESKQRYSFQTPLPRPLFIDQEFRLKFRQKRLELKSQLGDPGLRPKWNVIGSKEKLF